MSDAAQEFAERVAKRWFRDLHGTPYEVRHLATLIASELRAGGWIPGPDGPCTSELCQLQAQMESRYAELRADGWT